MSPAVIQIENLRKRFGAVAALDGISLQIRAGEFFSLLGPSGCGKSTLLRIIAGLEAADSGELKVSGRSMLGVPPQQRPVNTVFQNYALFPHLTTFDNVAFGLRMRKRPADEIASKVQRALELVHVTELADRFPNQISGGQKQRVALARALVNEPEVLLLDEPLAAIDAKLRTQLQAELKNVQRQLKTTFIYVTHDQDEALALSDRIAVMRAGCLEQVGTPKEVYDRPRSRFVAGFVGACNVLEVRASANGAGDVEWQTAIGALKAPAGNGVAFGIRREHVEIAVLGRHDQCPNNVQTMSKVQLPKAGEVLENRVEGRVEDVSFTGSQTEYTVSVNGVILRSLRQSGAGEHKVGDMVQVHLPAESLFLMES